jgi:hypothetical protein
MPDNPPEKPQSFKSHAKWDPSFHFFLGPVALILLAYVVIKVVRNPMRPNIMLVVAMVWATVAMFKIRLYSLKVQDRIIRLEERLRLKQVLPAELAPRIWELSESQLIGLRFASDAELAGLCEKTLEGNLTQKQIKESIVRWRPDHFRV